MKSEALKGILLAIFWLLTYVAGFYVGFYSCQTEEPPVDRPDKREQLRQSACDCNICTDKFEL